MLPRQAVGAAVWGQRAKGGCAHVSNVPGDQALHPGATPARLYLREATKYTFIQPHRGKIMKLSQQFIYESGSVCVLMAETKTAEL